MRDYFLEPAQTNLELYAQAITSGYGPHPRRRMAQAYQFALRQVFPLARGSGKPFIAHLVGTASLVLASGCPEDWVTAALLHAVYQRRVPFSGGLEPERRRPVIAELFGTGVDDLIDRYTEFESQDLYRIPTDVVKANRDLVTLRLADELEDLCGHALALHGYPDSEEVSVRGSSAWRRKSKTHEVDGLLDKAQVLGLKDIARGISHWMDFASIPEDLNDFRTGWFSSVDLASADDENLFPTHGGPNTLGRKAKRSLQED